MRRIPSSDPTYGHYTVKERERIGTLLYRADFLQKRIDSAGNLDLSYDRAELAALRWALALIANRTPAERLEDEQPSGLSAR